MRGQWDHRRNIARLVGGEGGGRVLGRESDSRARGIAGTCLQGEEFTAMDSSRKPGVWEFYCHCVRDVLVRPEWIGQSATASASSEVPAKYLTNVLGG